MEEMIEVKIKMPASDLGKFCRHNNIKHYSYDDGVVTVDWTKVANQAIDDLAKKEAPKPAEAEAPSTDGGMWA